MPKKEILIVEDDPDMGTALRERLEFCGPYHCTCVAEAVRALEYLHVQRPDLILLDLGLGKIDGTAVLKNFRDWLPDGVSPPPVIVVSGNNEKDIVDYCMEWGANSFISKKSDLQELEETVHDYLA